MNQLLYDRINQEIEDTLDLTADFLPEVKSKLDEMLLPDHEINLIHGDASKVSLLYQHLEKDYKAYHSDILSINAKFCCTNTKCFQCVWTSSRATIQLHYRVVEPGSYLLVVRGFKRICNKCQGKSEVEVDLYEEEWFERVTQFIALRIRNTCHFDKTLKNAFKDKIDISRQELQTI